MPANEHALNVRFRLAAMGIIRDCPGDDDLCRWMFLMQHHGLPTRLLDWTESALAALFFAAEGRPQADGRLFIFLPADFNRAINNMHGLFSPTNETVQEIFTAASHGNPAPSRILAITTFMSNERVVRQLGAFTVHGRRDDLSQVAPDGIVQSIEIPAESKPKLLQTLAHLGVTRTTLFHDLDSLARDLREQFGFKHR